MAGNMISRHLCVWDKGFWIPVDSPTWEAHSRVPNKRTTPPRFIGLKQRQVNISHAAPICVPPGGFPWVKFSGRGTKCFWDTGPGSPNSGTILDNF